MALKINSNKSQAIIFGYPKTLKNINTTTLPRIKIDNTEIDYSSSVNNLGVTLDQSFTWIPQASAVCKKSYSTIHSMKRLRHIQPLQLKKLLVQSLVLPIFDYCDTLVNDANKAVTTKLDRAFNHAIKFIFNAKKSDHVTPLFKELKWLRLHSRRKLHTLNLVHKVLNNSCPSYFINYFTYPNNSKLLGTRPSGKLSVPVHKTDICSKTFLVLGAKYWNAHTHPKSAHSSLPIFKRDVTDSLFNSEHLLSC